MQTVRLFLNCSGPSNVWDALRAVGHSEASLVNNPQIVAWVAKRNHIQNFRSIREGTCVELPIACEAHRVIAKVSENPGKYGEALQRVYSDMRDHFGGRKRTC